MGGSWLPLEACSASVCSWRALEGENWAAPGGSCSSGCCGAVLSPGLVTFNNKLLVRSLLNDLMHAKDQVGKHQASLFSLPCPSPPCTDFLLGIPMFLVSSGGCCRLPVRERGGVALCLQLGLGLPELRVGAVLKGSATPVLFQDADSQGSCAGPVWQQRC